MTIFLNSAESYLTNSNKPWLIIFLDIDGVLYREPVRDGFWEERHEKMVEIFGNLDRYWSFHYDVATAYYFNTAAVALLEDFIDLAQFQYQVGIVLSSAWREGRSLEEIHRVFSPWRFSQFIIDKTVDSRNYPIEELPKSSYGYSSRADQINYWLHQNVDMNIAHFIIFDDQNGGIAERFPDQFVRVKTPYLSLENIKTATTIIKACPSPTIQASNPLANPPTPMLWIVPSSY